jgi:hypothetical protein
MPARQWRNDAEHNDARSNRERQKLESIDDALRRPLLLPLHLRPLQMPPASPQPEEQVCEMKRHCPWPQKESVAMMPKSRAGLSSHVSTRKKLRPSARKKT